jgi:hypothetical protein
MRGFAVPIAIVLGIEGAEVRLRLREIRQAHQLSLVPREDLGTGSGDNHRHELCNARDVCAPNRVADAFDLNNLRCRSPITRLF